MKKNWHMKDGFQVLKQRIMDGMIYVAFAGKPISNDDALNMHGRTPIPRLTFSSARNRYYSKQVCDEECS